MAQKRKLTKLSLAGKVNLLEIIEKGKKKKQEIAKDFGIYLKLIENYSPDYVFNVDKTGLFFKCLPEETFMFKGQSCSGGKHCKERVTFLLGGEYVEHRKIKTTYDWQVEKTTMFKTSKIISIRLLCK